MQHVNHHPYTLFNNRLFRGISCLKDEFNGALDRD